MIAAVGRVLRIGGAVVRFIGAGCLFITGVIGALVLDLLIPVRHHDKHSPPLIFTALMWGMLWANGSFLGSYRYKEPLTLFVSSIIMTSIAIGILLICAMPMVGALVAMAWGIAAGITLLGMGLEMFGKGCQSCNASYQEQEPEPLFSYDRLSAQMGPSPHLVPREPAETSYDASYRPPSVNPNYRPDEEALPFGGYHAPLTF